ncbi:dnaj-class molecular chaperone with c-terminal zn finger domain [Halogeometricum borinquense DSM 11551]|uniref:DnaJ-class molecular Chaperone with C-terminal Zn finger domain n=2 Tax=Halogeometricum borinquense TaxID=60847 RepID=E4NRC1_HALBP|nr:J domain-containing protein [Halogeometricum borinquense]ADQ67962.1 DnaJ-class molecular chaperone with C-terminal Zn finger domain [Halogeometricum borinquense DSM 11551]ELY24118.1 dnaj-class molecular chaperone with c-terminal zn finger domain [Halogeometricum borinquense DSM 11551]RYJ13117.1 J domain-containing protein [Halogeometricum borinquense]
MLPDWVSLIPAWLVFGIAGGLLASVVVAGVFVVGGRLFPDEPVSRGAIDGAARRRMEIRNYLRQINEPFAEDHPIHGETVEFYLPSRDVAVTFDAQAYFRLECAGTYTVLCEHEMPARALGRRLPFEVPEFGHARPKPDDPVTAAFDHLDLPRTASPAEVKVAYRDKVKTAHPDHGGSQAEFQRLQEAYATAKEHAERAIAS